jgi:hypothetical protein
MLVALLFFFSVYGLDNCCINNNEFFSNDLIQCESFSEFECSVQVQCSLMNVQNKENKCFLKKFCTSYSHMPEYPCTLLNVGDYCFNTCDLFTETDKLQQSFENLSCHLKDGKCVSNPCTGFTGPKCPDGCLIMRDQDVCIPDGCASISLESSCKESGMGCDFEKNGDGDLNCRCCLKIFANIKNFFYFIKINF